MNALEARNIMGNSNFSHIIGFYGYIELLYNETLTDREHHSLTINYCFVKGIHLNMLQNSYRVKLIIINMQIERNTYRTSKRFMEVLALGKNEVLIINCQFVSNSYSHHLLLFSSTHNGSVQFINCQFINNAVLEESLRIYSSKIHKKPILIKLEKNINVEINNCDILNSGLTVLQITGTEENPANVIIINTNFIYSATLRYDSGPTYSTRIRRQTGFLMVLNFISLSHTTLTLVSSVNFNNISDFGLNSIIGLEGNSTITISGAVNFSYNNVTVLIDLHESNVNLQYIMIQENSILNISHNEITSFFNTSITKMHTRHFCIFQYFTILTSKVKLIKHNFAIILYAVA